MDYLGFIINYLRKRKVRGSREVLEGYPYLNNLIQLCPGDWVKQMSKINEAVGMKNR